MKKLTESQINYLASGKGVRKIAVENVLMSMGNNYDVKISNFYMDVGLYKWNSATVKACLKGIDYSFEKRKIRIPELKRADEKEDKLINQEPIDVLLPIGLDVSVDVKCCCCGIYFQVESDASGVYECSSCGAKLNLIPQM